MFDLSNFSCVFFSLDLISLQSNQLTISAWAKDF